MELRNRLQHGKERLRDQTNDESESQVSDTPINLDDEYNSNDAMSIDMVKKNKIKKKKKDNVTRLNVKALLGTLEALL